MHSLLPPGWVEEMSYESSIFRRSSNSLALSQRFRNNWHKFKGTLNVALQALPTNTLLQALSSFSSSLVLVFFCIYLLLLILLAILLIKQLYYKHIKRRKHQDFDLLSVVDSRETASNISEAEFVKALMCVIILYLAIVFVKNRPWYWYQAYLFCMVTWWSWNLRLVHIQFWQDCI